MKKFLAAALAAFSAVTIVADDSSSAIIRLLNSRASGSAKTFAEAALVVARDAAAGNPLQQYVIAVVSEDRSFPASAKPTDATRREYLEKSRGKIVALAERKNNPLAWYLLSLEKNDLVLLKRAADGGNPQALNAWGTFTLSEALSNPGVKTNDVDRILEKSFGYFKRAASMKDVNGLYNLGMCYMRGYGVERNENMAFDCFRTSAEMGHPEAINNIGGFFRDGIVVGKNPAMATKWFKKSADLGNAYGELNYALALQRGEGIEKDEKKAVEMFSSAASRGNPEAMNAYAMCLYNGSGVEKDLRAAVQWYRHSASFGFPPAMDNLAACYERGDGVARDMMRSTVWKVRARAARGDRNAAAWLAQNGHSLR